MVIITTVTKLQINFQLTKYKGDIWRCLMIKKEMARGESSLFLRAFLKANAIPNIKHNLFLRCKLTIVWSLDTNNLY